MSLPTPVTDQDFDQEVLEADTVVLVDFWAEWCGPCKMVAPVLDDLSQEYDGKIKFTKVDVDENPETAMKYGIRSIPTLLVFKGGAPWTRWLARSPRQYSRSDWTPLSKHPLSSRRAPPWEWIGSGGLRGLQIRRWAPYGVHGGFDSLPLPP